MRHLITAALMGLVLLACSEPMTTTTSHQTSALGEPTDGFPDWAERVVHVWTNRARADPATELASCSACAEADCYGPRDPVVWDHNLGRAARFHSANLNLAGCGLQHDSPCTVVADISDQYVPGPCDGAPSCACSGGSANCGSTGTTWSTRIGYFGTGANAENIARGGGNPLSTFYMWLYESDSNPACGWRMANGHRANILGGARSMGVGRDGSTYTQDFGGGTVPTGVIAGVHYPQTGADIEFHANWFDAQGPLTARVSIEGTCHSMALERGVETNGAYLASVTGLDGSCVRYVFHFTDSTGTDVFHPSTGGYTINCAEDWDPARPAPCGPCTPDCSGRACGDDGCGGSCATCSDGLSCVDYQCVCQGEMCGGSCVDTQTDPAHCGGCDQPCTPGQLCAGGSCLCQPDCSCGGSCVDTATDEANCGVCGTKCKGNTKWCIDSNCVRDCVVDCTDHDCGNDGCRGSCGDCSGLLFCNVQGLCVCPSGQSDCGGSCVDTQIDELHCGGCDAPCGGGELCIAGVCGGGGVDAGQADASSGSDSAASDDATTVADAGATDTSGPTVDAATADDATTADDAGSGQPDAATGVDSGSAVDSGVEVDAASSADAGTTAPDSATPPVDAAVSAEDAGADASSASPDAAELVETPESSGCACRGSQPPAAPFAAGLMALVWLAVARRRRS